METSVKAAEVLAPPQPDEASSVEPESSEGAAARPSPGNVSAMEEFCRRLQDIIRTHGSAADQQMQQSVVEAEMETLKEEVKGDLIVATDTDVSLIKQSLNNLSSPEEKLEDLVLKYADLAALRRSDEQKLKVFQQKLSVVLEERKQLQAEHRSSVAARGKLETLCRELHAFHDTMREDTLQRCREDEEKRKEMSVHFQEMLTEIQAQIEQHSGRNEKLRLENSNLTDKLESLMGQCERREESLDKINNHHDLKLKLTEARLQQANALLTEAQEKHSREKEYLLREAIDKTKKCFAMKELELTMKKKLALYAQKFDDFQETLAKSNEIYVRFRKEMNNMSDKMKKVEKESSLWKTRFENCNTALTDMIQERAEKGKEYDLFVLRIHKLEKLCRALQEERKGLYEKIKEVRSSHESLTSNFSNNLEEVDESAVAAPLEEIQVDDPVLTENMARLKEEQAKLQEFAVSLFAAPDFGEDPEDKEDLDLEEDIVASAFVQFQTKPRDKQDPMSESEPVEDGKPAESHLPLSVRSEEVQKDQTPEETIQIDRHPEVEDGQKQDKTGNMEPVKEEIQQPEPEPETAKVDPEPEPETAKVDPEPEPETAKVDPEPEPETAKVDPEPRAETAKVDPEPRAETAKVDPEPEPETAKVDPDPEPETPILQKNVELPEKDEKIQKQPATEPEPAPKESDPPSEDTSKSAASSKKQAPKKKKKRSGKSAS